MIITSTHHHSPHPHIPAATHLHMNHTSHAYTSASIIARSTTTTTEVPNNHVASPTTMPPAPTARPLTDPIVLKATTAVQNGGLAMAREGFDLKHWEAALGHAERFLMELTGPPAVGGGGSAQDAQQQQKVIAKDMSPTQYYDVWLKVCDELKQLSLIFQEAVERGDTTMVALYERVQRCGSVVARLYLMMTVGATFVKAEVLWDLLEMSKGVQHPVRGLFLRNYLLSVTKDKLHLLGNSAAERCEYVLQNLSETTKLWMRLTQVVTVMDPSRREIERRQLGQLVGQNLFRLAEEMDLSTYEKVLLPRVLQIINNCAGDSFVQSYLCEVLTQVVPAEFQVETLDTFLDFCCIRLKPGADVKQITLSLLDRLNALSFSSVIPMDSRGTELFPIVFNYLTGVSSHLQDTLAMHVGLARFALKPWIALVTTAAMAKSAAAAAAAAMSTSMSSSNLGELGDTTTTTTTGAPAEEQITLERRKNFEKYDRVLASAVALCVAADKPATPLSQAEETSVIDLLNLPLDVQHAITDPQFVLSLVNYGNLIKFLSPGAKRVVAGRMLRMSAAAPLTEVSGCERVFNFCRPIICPDYLPGESRGPFEQDDGEGDAAAAIATTGKETETTIHEQFLVAKLIHRLDNNDPAILFTLLEVARAHVSRGGMSRRKNTLLPLSYRYLELAKRTGPDQKGLVRKCLQACHELVTTLATSDDTRDLAARLFLQASSVADAVGGQDAATYEFIAQAFVLHEETADSKKQSAFIPLMVGTLIPLTSLNKDNLEALQTKTALYGASLLKKPDQCRALSMCAHLFWSKGIPERALQQGETGPAPGRNGKRALECLQRAVKIADAYHASSMTGGGSSGGSSGILSLFVETLNSYIYFVAAGADKIKPSDVTKLIAMINEHLASVNRVVDPPAEWFYRSTLSYLRSLIATEGDVGKRFTGIDV